MREYANKNADKLKEARLVYISKNSEKIKAKMSEYGARYYVENIDKIKVYQAAYWEKNRERRIEYRKMWKAENPDKVNAQTARRRAARAQRTPNWLTPDQLKQIDEFYAEAKRIEEETGIKHHVDHIIPMRGKNVSGLHVPENLRVIPAKANMQKNNRYDPSA
jgi:hypothetical protein